MKKCKRIYLGIGFVLFISSLSFSQDASSDEDAITLPDVSTVVSGGAIKAGKSAVPDYSEVLPKNSSDSEIMPEFPNSENIKNINLPKDYVSMIRRTIENLVNVFSKVIYIAGGNSASNYQAMHLLNPAYYLTEIPVSIPFGELFLISSSVILLSFVVSVIPAIKAGKERPLETFRKA